MARSPFALDRCELREARAVLDKGGVAPKCGTDIAEQCGHKLIAHEIPVAKLNDRRHPCHEK